jgi:hypothetical protein
MIANGELRIVNATACADSRLSCEAAANLAKVCANLRKVFLA